MFESIRKYSKRLDIWLFVFSMLFSFMLIVSNHVFFDWKTAASVEDIYVSDFHLLDIVWLFIYSAISYIGMKIVTFIFQAAEPFFYREPRKAKKSVFIGCFIFILLLWIPYIMSYWPGGIYSDTVDSINMALGKKELDNHNPLFYTLIWRFMFWVTGAFSGQGEYGGLKLFTIVQSVMLALTLSGFIYWSYKKGIHKLIIFLEILIAAICPLYPFYGISLWKDTIFSIVIFIFSVFLYHLFEKKQEDISNTNLLLYGILTALIIFLRNNGIYIAIFCSVMLCLLCLKNSRVIGKKIGILSFVIVAVSCIIQGPVYDKCGYNIDTSTESLGIPLQQVAYIYTTDGRVNAEELEVLDNLLPLENWKNLYDPIVADYIKFDPSFNKEYLEENAGEFLKTYLSIIVKNPVKAVKGYFLQTMGFWDIFKSSPTAYICNAHFGNVEYFMSDYFDYYFDICFRDYAEPRVYVSSAIFVWLMLGSIFICLSKRNYREIICILPTLGLWLSIMVAVPVAFSFRYVYSLFLCVPLYIMVSIKSFQKYLG